MELAKHIKEQRARLGMSQEALAEAVFVSRQTISNWETDRTYPDVQSLLLLSALFDTTVDKLIKGDVSKMEETCKHDWALMQRLAIGMTIFRDTWHRSILCSVSRATRRLGLAQRPDIRAGSGALRHRICPSRMV